MTKGQQSARSLDEDAVSLGDDELKIQLCVFVGVTNRLLYAKKENLQRPARFYCEQVQLMQTLVPLWFEEGNITKNPPKNCDTAAGHVYVLRAKVLLFLLDGKHTFSHSLVLFFHKHEINSR